MTIEAKVIAHSRPFWAEDNSTDLITLQLRYPRIIHSEFMTHRVFSRSASSSRAIPLRKTVEALQKDFYSPIFALDRAGMSPGEKLDEDMQLAATLKWQVALQYAVNTATGMVEKNHVHKQWANRLLEPFSHISVVVTATEWSNFFELRDHGTAQSEIQELARAMRAAIDASIPKILTTDAWHSPYAPHSHWHSAARCARVSYNNHDGSTPSQEDDQKLALQLLESRHLSPFEHQAYPMRKPVASDTTSWEPGVTHMDRQWRLWSGNFRGWIQHRQTLGEQQENRTS